MKINLENFSTNQKMPDSYLFYTLQGDEDYIDDSGYPRLDKDGHKVFAKCIKNKPSKNFGGELQYRFYIKTDPNKIIINPIKKYSIEKSKSTFLNKTCKSEDIFTEVSESIFNQYMNFLKSKNTKWLNNAQREIR